MCRHNKFDIPEVCGTIGWTCFSWVMTTFRTVREINTSQVCIIVIGWSMGWSLQWSITLMPSVIINQWQSALWPIFICSVRTATILKIKWLFIWVGWGIEYSYMRSFLFSLTGWIRIGMTWLPLIEVKNAFWIKSFRCFKKNRKNVHYLVMKFFEKTWPK